MNETTGVLFVCLGNICRSPLGEGIFRHLVTEAGLAESFRIDSAGTGAWHVGEPPDPRSSAVAERRGVSLAGQRARKVRSADFTDFEYILAMDRSNRRDLIERSPASAEGRIHLLRDYDPVVGHDVPDPYYGGARGFDDVFEMIERSCVALLSAIRERSQ